jgi:hypothetical protein
MHVGCLKNGGVLSRNAVSPHPEHRTKTRMFPSRYAIGMTYLGMGTNYIGCESCTRAPQLSWRSTTFFFFVHIFCYEVYFCPTSPLWFAEKRQLN